jgi:diaminopimelate decarboxylase
MDHFSYRDGQLFCEDVNLDELVDQVGTPAYVYSKRTLVEHYDRFRAAFAALDPLVCFAIKSCANIHLLRALVERGAGVDVVSGGELYRALSAKTPVERIVAAGVGKTEAELRYLLSSKVGWINVESEQEFETAAALARELGVKCNVAVRVNPDVADAKTHAKTTTGKKGSKFGVDLDRIEAFFEAYGKDPQLALRGLHVHIGSPIYSPEPYVAAFHKMVDLISRLQKRGFSITSLDIGGGFSANYDGKAPEWTTYAQAFEPVLADLVKSGVRIIMEPGRTIAANSGVLITEVQYIKHGGGRQFAIVDAGMSQHIRPAMYDAYHFIWPTRVAPNQVPTSYTPDQPSTDLEHYDVAGPICESSDFLARDRKLPHLERGCRLCMFTSGAYGMVMASQYNAAPRPPEILVDGRSATLIRRRESYEDLVAAELAPTSIGI